jgi:nucleoside-diphosphate-sugar epimerase
MQEYYNSCSGYKEAEVFKVIESKTLGLDITKSLQELDWAPELTLDKMLFDVVDFFKRQEAGENERDICLRQVREFFVD